MPSASEPLTVSRSDLYELVWSKPMTELAKDFGMSDVALAKRCRKLGVPVPGRGYWARVAAGQKPHRPKLKKREDSLADYRALTFGIPLDEPETPAAADPDDVTGCRQAIRSVDITESEDLVDATPPIKRTAMHLKRPWRREIRWQRGERKGPIVATDVDEQSVDRALRIADSLIQSARQLNWPFAERPTKEDTHSSRRYGPPSRSALSPGCLLVEGEAIIFRIHERHRRVKRPLTSEQKARIRRGETFYSREWDHEPTGELRLTITRTNNRYATHTWSDGKRTPLEKRMPQILDRLLDEALKIKSNREQRRLAEIERQRQEEIRRAQSRRRAANAKLIHELEAQAGAWFRARFLRSYVQALKRATGTQRLEAKRDDETIDFIDWADRYVAQLDPLCTASHDEDLKADRPSYFSPSDSKVLETLGRLLGRDWENAFKLSAAADDLDASDSSRPSE